MTATVKSVLFVDYDSLYLGLRARDPGMARRFASRPGAWIDAIENGELIVPGGAEPVRRRILMRRCYADPKLLGKARNAFTSHGFQIVDCPPLPGRERNSAEIQMVLDTVDALGHQTGFEEFILLSADSDLTPVIFRLRSYNRATTIYASALTSGGYRAIADSVIEEARLIAVLAPTADAEAPENEEIDEEAAAARTGGDRDDLAALARRVHQATNVPLFSPKVYGDLFRALANEIAENGYHFQATAENVAARLVAAGRNASRRQIAFVVKGLALKGHVFSVGDTAEKLADVFREQVLYLARNAGLEFDDGAEQQIRYWIVGRGGPAEPSRPALPPPAPTAAEPATPTVLVPPAPVEPEAPRLRPISIKPAISPIPQPIRPITIRPIPSPPPASLPPAAEKVAAERSAPLRPGSEKPAVANGAAPVTPAVPPSVILMPPPAPTRAEAPRAEPPKAELPKVEPFRSEPSRQEPPRQEPPRQEPRADLPGADLQAEPPPPEPVRPRSPIAPPRARTPQPSPEPTPEPPVPARVVSPIRPPAPRGVTLPVRPPARRPTAPQELSRDGPQRDGPTDPIENSILAAIAQAVDVLVIEDGIDKSAPPAIAPPEPPAREAPAARETPPSRDAPPPRTPAAAPEPADDGDIGDEIQRILAAYSQSRKPGGGK